MWYIGINIRLIVLKSITTSQIPLSNFCEIKVYSFKSWFGGVFFIVRILFNITTNMKLQRNLFNSYMIHISDEIPFRIQIGSHFTL